MKVLFLTRYGQQGASSRLRSLQFIPALSASDIECEVSPLFDDVRLLNKYQHGHYSLLDLLLVFTRRFRILMQRHRFDLLWIEKEALPWFPVWLEKWLLRGVPYALDFDDAIFHNYDLHSISWVRRIYGQRIDCLMADAQLVVVGNRYLADKAMAAGSEWIEIIPTVVDLTRYSTKLAYTTVKKPIIVWIGSPSSIQYLLELAEPLRELSQYHSFTLRVIGGCTITMQGVDVESLSWSLDTEAALIVDCDVGIMPLRNTPWEQGKCAYKLIQYMACGLPTVASAIGANREVVIEGKTGFFADTPVDWVRKLALLLSDAQLRERLGKAGRGRVEKEYNLQQAAPKLVSLLTHINHQ